MPDAILSVMQAANKANTGYEIITVNDDPDSQEPPPPNIRNKKNMGVAYSRNAGIKASKGDFIVILDGDDMLTPSSIRNQLEVFKDEGIDIVHGKVYRFEGDLSYPQCVENNFKTHPSLITCQGMMVRRRVFEKHGLYFEGLRSAEDK